MDRSDAATSPPSRAVTNLRNALAKVDELIEEEEQVVAKRASKRATGKPTTESTLAKACSACRKAKNRCEGEEEAGKCTRCLRDGLACVFPPNRSRGPKKRLSKCVVSLVCPSLLPVTDRSSLYFSTSLPLTDYIALCSRSDEESMRR
jgi:hypothetical protein